MRMMMTTLIKKIRHCLRYNLEPYIFVSMDSITWGSPYAVTIDQAFDFGSKEAAEAYISKGEDFTYIEVHVEYSVQEKSKKIPYNTD